MINGSPIGIFDSGIGGLSITRRIRDILPNEHLIYIADSAHAPYGEKLEAYINQRSVTIIDYLLQRNVKAVVIACNTATVSSIKYLRSKYTIPIIGVEPGIKPAALITRTGVIGVLATTQTLKSDSFINLLKGFSANVQIELQACPGLMEQVEALSLESEKTVQLIHQYLSPLLQKGADNIVLGCTHYAFLAPIIEKIAGPNVNIINTDVAVSKETVRRLQADNLLSVNSAAGYNDFMSSGDLVIVQQQIRQLWGESVDVSFFTG